MTVRTFVLAVVAIVLVIAGIVYRDPSLVKAGVGVAEQVEAHAPTEAPEPQPVDSDTDHTDGAAL